MNDHNKANYNKYISSPRSSRNEDTNPLFHHNSFYNRQYYQSSLSFQRLLTLSTSTIADLADPLSIFDEIEVSKQRRSLAVSSLPSEYKSAESDRLPVLNNINRNRADVFREQKLIDIQHSIHDIEEDLTSFERQSRTSRLPLLRRPNMVIILKHDSKNHDNEVNFDEYEEVILEETLDADQFLHDLGAPSKNYSMFIDSESNNPSQPDLLNATINLFSNDHIDPDIDQLLQNTFLHQLTSTNQSTKRNMDSSIPIRSEISITSEFNSPAVSQNTIFFQEHYPDITADIPQTSNSPIAIVISNLLFTSRVTSSRAAAAAAATTTAKSALVNTIQTTTSANDEGDQTPDRINSTERSLSRSTSSAHSSLKSNSGKKSTGRKSNSRHSSTAANERSQTNQQRHSSSSSSSSSNNHEVERPMTFPGERQETPINEHEEYLDDKPRSLQNFDERSLSDRSISQRSESGLSSSANSALPLNLDSSDLEDNEIPRSKTTSPQKRNSSLSKNPPQDQIQSPNPANGIHPERLSSRHSNENLSTEGHRKPIQSVNNTLEQKLLSQPLQTKVHSPKALTFKQNGSSHEVEQKAKIQLPPMSPKNNTSLSNYKQEQNSTHQSPSISPVHFDERKRKVQKSPTSDSVKNTEGHHQTHENLTAQFKSNKNEHSTTISPRRHEVDDTNHTSIEGNATSSLTLPNEKTNTSNTNHHTTKKQASVRSTSPNDPNNEFFEPKSEREQRQRRVSFSGSPVHPFVEEQHMDPNWRERVASILASKHQPNEKYAYVQARVNSFENFDYHPRKFNVISRKIYHSKSDNEEDNVLELNQHKSKNPNDRKELFVQEQIGDEQHIHSIKDLPVQMFGRLMFLADGSPTIFHEPLEWHSASRLKEYSYENFNYTPRRKEVKIYDKKPRWHSESKLSDFVKESPRFFQRDTLAPANSLPHISDAEQAHLYQEQFDRRLQHHFPNNRSYTPILEEKDGRIGGPKVPQRRHDHIQDKSKDSTIQIFHKTPQWDGVPKFRMHSPARVHPSRTTLSNGQIFNEKLNWNARAKVHCWSELDLRKLDRKKAIVTYPNLKRNNRVLSPINPPKVSKHTKMIFDRPTRVRNSQLKDYVWENYNYKSHRRNRKTPPRKPKWNAVSKTRSLNSVYNPKTRRGWDRESRRKRVNKLPPLKRKREHEDLPQLPSNDQLAIDYNYERSPTTQAHTNRSEYALTSSRRSSKVLLPINHRQRFPDLELPNETTPRSHRPIQQEWYDEMNKSRLTHRMDGDGSNNHSFLHSVTPIHQSNTPRDLLPYRSTPRNSQNSGMSGTLLDTSIRTNRATEIRLAKNMDEHHQHCHDVSQSMPLEIRGFELEGTQCTVPVDATIRPLSNVNYRTSERVKNHRLYPWSMLHGPGTLSRNSSLLPIAEFRRPSLDTTITETQ
ncbi:hypothetical protein I4U23_028584 [Adineta vaga]|nr:hypothetical protein I4U23_028584 [Adineta vaga]